MNDAPPPSIHEVVRHQDTAFTSPSMRAEVRALSPIRVGKDAPVKQAMNAGGAEQLQESRCQDPKRSPEFKMQLRHKPKLTDAVEWHSTTSQATRKV